MYKKIIVIIILSFFFVLSCAKENPNNPNNSDNISGGGGDTGGSSGDGGNTGDGGDGGQNQPSLSDYAGAWEGDGRVHVFGENYYIRKMGSSSGDEVVFITDIQYSSTDSGFKVYYKAPKKELDAIVSFSSETSGNIKGKEYKYYQGSIQNINYNIKKLLKGTGIDPQYVGTYKCTNTGGGTHYSININVDGSIECFYDKESKFKIPAEQIIKNNKGIYENYLYKTTYGTKDAVLEITLEFVDSVYCKFDFKYSYTSNSGGGNSGTFDDYIKQN
ncbi:hypothetical protein [Brachyspira pilosicoli]|uniref:hypothetical protein n=1 Tax=Brachyspira pilosicoli TaxID=52584 RepID=UPI001CA48CD6|nr:hypothetical protein [Brachyspira pilosicoli]MBW5397514.1 hypothetical protein [Brachyspira pilosicoli]